MKEVIVVEGKNDYQAVKKAYPDAEIIITSGFGLNKEIMARIKTAQRNRGVIIFTDPDHMGEIIRKKIAKEVPGVKHCYISRKSATYKGDIGIENAKADTIVSALANAKSVGSSYKDTFTYQDLVKNGLVESSNSQQRRESLGTILGIGYANGKTFLRRLNNFGIERTEFEQALSKIRGDG